MAEQQGDRWVEKGLVAFGGLGTVIGIGTWLGARFDVLMAFVAGGGWIGVIALLVASARQSRHHDRLIADVKEAHEMLISEFKGRCDRLANELLERDNMIAEWRTIAQQNTDSLNRLVSHVIPVPTLRRQTEGAQAQVRELGGGLDAD